MARENKHNCLVSNWDRCLMVVVYIAISVLSLYPLKDIPQIVNVPFADKWAHCLMYFGVSCCAWIMVAVSGGSSRSAGSGRRHRFFWQTFFTLILPIVFGGVMEILQASINTGRSGDIMDFLANSVGVLLALPVGLYVILPTIRRFIGQAH